MSNCLPLPTGAIIASGLTCFEPGCQKCPVVDGYYAGIPCGCDPPPQGTNLAVWIPCSCLNAAQAGGDSCPVFRAILPDGSPMCVRPNFAAGPVPNVSGGTVTCAHVPGGCCTCCSGCVGTQCQPYSESWTNGVSSGRHTGPTLKFCCNPSAASMTWGGFYHDYAETIPGGACNGQLLGFMEFHGSRNATGGSWSYTYTHYECGNPNNATVDQGTFEMPGGACGFGVIPNPLGGSPAPYNGSLRVDCYSIVEAWSWDGGPGGHHGDWQFSMQINPAAGNCDTPCRGSGSGGSGGRPVATGEPRGCAGCGGRGTGGSTI